MRKLRSVILYALTVAYLKSILLKYGAKGEFEKET